MDADRKYARPAQVFVGRRLELAALTAALDTARAGEPQVVLIQGEAGIGKSSLVCEFLGGQPGVPVVTASGDRRATRLTLDGLDVDELGMLCRVLGRTGLSGRTFRRLRQHTGGNPLLARALLAELTDEALPPPAAALGEAERAGILLEQETPSGWRVSFAHLLVRQAVYGDLGAERRRALHLRAAAIVGGEEALAHRTAAAVGADPELAEELDQAASRATDAGKLRLAARYRQQAAAVTGPGPGRDERTLSSFELLVRAADVAQAEAARPAVEQLPVGARRDAALGQLALLAARLLDARTLLRAAWDAHDAATDEAAGAEAALGLGMLFGISGSFTESTVWLDRALGSATGSEPWYDAARSMRAVPFTLSGEGDKALSLFRDLPERPAMVPLAQTDSVTYRGLVKLWTGDLRGAAEDLGLAARRVRAGLQVRFPGEPLAFLAEAEFRRGRWDDCQDHAELAVSLARDADRYYDLPGIPA